MTLWEFIGRYLSDETLREEVFTDETTLKNYIKEEYALVLAQLREHEIFDLIKKDSGLTPNQIDELRDFLKNVGFDAKEARRIIWEGGAMCQRGTPPPPPPPPTSPPQDSMDVKMTGGYGSGEVHLRKVDPSTAVHNQLTEIELAGQGFNSALQVKFIHVATNVEVVGTITKRRADADVHQYRTVEVTFTAPGLWGVWLYDSNISQYRPFTCGITVT